MCSSNSSAAYSPAGPVPTTATSRPAKSLGSDQSKLGRRQGWNSGPSAGRSRGRPAKWSALTSTYTRSGPLRVSAGTAASTGQASAHAPQSMQTAGSTYSMGARPKPSSSGVGWMQLTGHAETQDASLQQFCVMTYATAWPPTQMRLARLYSATAGGVSSPALPRNSIRPRQLERSIDL